MHTRTLSSVALAGLLLVGCGQTSSENGGQAGGSHVADGGGQGGPKFSEPGQNVAVELPPDLDGEQLALELAKLDGLDASGFAARLGTSFDGAPSYQRAQIAGLDLIQASSLALHDAGLAAVETQGFTIAEELQFPSFAYGYQTIYALDLPLYVSADSILYAIHASFDSILMAIENDQLIPALDSLLRGMHERLGEGAGQDFGAAARADADLYLAVARSLLTGRGVTPLAGAPESGIKSLVDDATAASGPRDVSLFGVVRENEDFSQFKPRGHYAGEPALERYFRAMMWLGRIDFRLLETRSDGTQVFRRQQFDAMLLLHRLVRESLMLHYDRLDRTITAFVGEHDYMTLADVQGLLSALGTSDPTELAKIPDQQIAQAIVDGGFGAQRISSHIMVNGSSEGTLPLSRSFALFGQRYVVDSHVFSNVVYDRIGGRMMPSALDAAFAALGNDQAGSLLEPELQTYEAGGYPAALAKMRLLVDQHPPEYWGSSLYTLWLGALRELSPHAETVTPALFPAARSESWGRRLLGTQLSSWAELRHDTLLYAKQSYTGGVACEFPDAYVEPYPEFFAAVGTYARRGMELVEQLDLPVGSSLATALGRYFELVSDVSMRLEGMAEHELTGASFTPEMMEFINDAVVIDEGCGDPSLSAGWYRQLFFDPDKAVKEDPIIADVHTQPTDEFGSFVGRVLHVGTGTPRLILDFAPPARCAREWSV